MGQPRFTVVLAAVAVTSVIAPAPARADEFSLHALLTSQTGVTTNAFSTPEGGSGSSAPSVNYQVRPGLLFSYHTHRMLHELAVDTGLDGNDFTSNVTLTYRGAWRMTYSLTPRSEAEAGASVSGGRVNALATSAAANVGGPAVLPTGQVDFFQADASESISYEWSPLLSLRQNTFVRYVQTTNGDEVPPGGEPPVNTSGLEVGAGLSAERAFKVTALSLQVQSTFQRLGTQEVGPGTMVDNRDQLDLRGTLRLRRDFTRRWSGAVEAGVVSLIPLETGDELIYQPIGAIDVAYFPNWGSAGLSLRHVVAPNLFLAQNEISDSVVINAALPLPYLAQNRFNPRLTVLTSTGFSHTRFIDLTDGSDRAAFNVFYGDVALQYTPKPNIQLALRYQFVKQSDTDVAVPDPMLNQLGYIRHTILFTFAGRWPERLAAEIPLRSQIRVRSLTPVGEGDTSGITSGGGDR